MYRETVTVVIRACKEDLAKEIVKEGDVNGFFKERVHELDKILKPKHETENAKIDSILKHRPSCETGD